MARFRDRDDAGARLAVACADRLLGPPDVVLALPRGGVVVGAAVADRLGCPLDVVVVRKVGMPGHAEFAIGAVAEGGVAVVSDTRTARSLGPAYEEALDVERAEIRRRRQAYAGSRSAVDVAGASVCLVDDGMATGATMRAAVASVRARSAAHVAVAVPVTSTQAYELLHDEADEVLSLSIPARFGAVGAFYDDFRQVSERTVLELLAGR